MRDILRLLLLLIIPVVFANCRKELSSSAGRGSSYSSDAGSVGGSGGQAENEPGVITAGEWNDLNNWQFWQDLMDTSTYNKMPDYWSLHNNNRVSVLLTSDNGQPVPDAIVELKKNGTTVFTGRSDVKGRAELFTDILQKNSSPDISKYSISVNEGAKLVNEVKWYKDGINEIRISAGVTESKVEIAFVVDATGSMGDELEYLKTELLDVIARAKAATPSMVLGTSALFYRDKGDAYVTRRSGFSNNISTTLNFIKDQEASGGGDTPEAVHTAMREAVDELQWSNKARARILFLLLDAPPHYESDIVKSLQATVLKASQKGIKIIPIVASGIDKETEFLMRMFAITTNGTYVFITNDSGIGNDHLTPTVGRYEVEFLNDLLVRLIKKYTE